MKDSFLFSEINRLWDPSQPPIQWLVKALSLVLEKSQRATVYTPPSSAEVKNGLRCTSTPPYAYTTCPETSVYFTFLRTKYLNLKWTVSQRS